MELLRLADIALVKYETDHSALVLEGTPDWQFFRSTMLINITRTVTPEENTMANSAGGTGTIISTMAVIKTTRLAGITTQIITIEELATITETSTSQIFTANIETTIT